MGKHSGNQDSNDIKGPHGPGPHPTPDESQKKADSFDRLYEYNKKRSEDKK